MDGFDWSQMELFLAIYREGSVTGAARRLRVDQSTVSRRLLVLEAAVGSLFARSKVGTHPTALATRWLPLAERAEEAMREALVLAAAGGKSPEGRVRLALPEALADHTIAPALPEFLARFPRISLVLDTRIELSKLARLEADVALRFVRPSAGDLLAQRIGTSRLGVFGRRDYVERHLDRPLHQLDWIGWHSALSFLPEARWLDATVGIEPRVACSKATTILAAVRAGAGVALLPERFALSFAELARMPAPGWEMPALEVWLVRPAVHRGAAHVEVVAAWLAGILERLSPADARGADLPP